MKFNYVIYYIKQQRACEMGLNPFHSAALMWIFSPRNKTEKKVFFGCQLDFLLDRLRDGKPEQLFMLESLSTNENGKHVHETRILMMLNGIAKRTDIDLIPFRPRGKRTKVISLNESFYQLSRAEK